jgi:HK97 family phage major capsid protein
MSKSTEVEAKALLARMKGTLARLDAASGRRTAPRSRGISPSTLAALRDDYVPTVRTLAQRIDASDVIRRARAGKRPVDTESDEILSRREFSDLLRTRATVTDATGVVVPQWTRDSVDLPGSGGRLAGLFRIRDAPEPAVGVSEETGTPTGVVAPTDYGTALPESAATYTRTELADSRFGAYVHATASILKDSQALADSLDYVLTRDMGRQTDVELLSGDGTGTAYGKHFLGLANLGLTTQTVGALSRWEALVTAAGAVRAANWIGPITHVLHPTDVVSLLKEKTVTALAPVFADAVAGLALLGADNFIVSANATQGTAWTGSWSEFGTIYVRQAPEIRIATDDQSDFVAGMVKILVEARLAFRSHTNHLSAGIKITGL